MYDMDFGFILGKNTMNLFSIFLSVFLAELGDKTQLATLLFATDGKTSPSGVFCASAGALVLSSLIAVAAGTLAKDYLDHLPLKLFAGIGFIVIGGWTLFDFFKG